MLTDEAGLARLMHQSQGGDKRAYAALLEQVAAWLRRYLRRRVPPHQLDDLVQDVLLSLHEKRDSWDPGRAFLPWLAAIARYRWVDHLRRVYRNRDDATVTQEPSQDSDEGAVVARLSLERLLAQLPAGQADAIELVRIEGLSIAEASRKTGQSESLVKVNIHRGLKRMAALIETA